MKVNNYTIECDCGKYYPRTEAECPYCGSINYYQTPPPVVLPEPEATPKARRKTKRMVWFVVLMPFVLFFVAGAQPKDIAGYSFSGMIFGMLAVFWLVVVTPIFYFRVYRWRPDVIADRKKAEKEASKREAEEAERMYAVAAVLISTEDEYGKSVTGTAARMLLGGALMGAVGAAIGLHTARSKVKARKATFSVMYKDGRTGIETVNVNSARFKELAKLVVKN